MIDPSDFTLLDVSYGDDGSREALYQRIDANPDYPMTVRIGYYPKASSGGNPATFNVSVRINTFVKKDAGETTEEVQAASAVLAWTMPWLAVPDATDIFNLAGNLFSWVVPDVATGALADDFIDKLQYGIVDIDLSNITRT
jgi:hypothetical protein